MELLETHKVSNINVIGSLRIKTSTNMGLLRMFHHGRHWVTKHL